MDMGRNYLRGCLNNIFLRLASGRAEGVGRIGYRFRKVTLNGIRAWKTSSHANDSNIRCYAHLTSALALVRCKCPREQLFNRIAVPPLLAGVW